MALLFLYLIDDVEIIADISVPIHEGTEAPKECPACKHEQAYYELLAKYY